jgi:hypothetical protein
MSTAASAPPLPRPPFAWGQFLALTVGAAAVFGLLRLIPTGSDLNHMDFRVDAKGGQAIEFCDPLNPQFIPVVAVKSPVVMEVAPAAPPVAGRAVAAVVTLRTARGKAIGPEDLQVTHTRRLHLLAVDPTLSDYQHLHPAPGARPGEWAFTFTPARPGTYRIFADFTPTATGRGLYASADVAVAAPADPPAAVPGAVGEPLVRDGHRFTLVVRPAPPRAGQPLDLRFGVERTDGAAFALGEVMDAFAHLVAFDAERSGFAHLHPVVAGPARPGPAPRTELDFKLTIPRAGRYTIWAQLSLNGREEFVPFQLEVK